MAAEVAAVEAAEVAEAAVAAVAEVEAVAVVEAAVVVAEVEAVGGWRWGWRASDEVELRHEGVGVAAVVGRVEGARGRSGSRPSP